MSRAAAAAAALLLLPSLAGAYHREDHYYSVRLALADLRPRIQGDETAAMCAQLADEASELNAIEVYRALMRHPLSYAGWSLAGRGEDAWTRRMATTQQLLHGLTGGSSQGLRAAAALAVAASRKRLDGRLPPQERADALCALGFALHLYGDSYAHARIRNPARMYGTGIGHFFDAAVPDFPLCGPRRRDAWEAYLLAAPALFSGRKRVSDLPSFLEATKALAGTADRSNAFQEGRLREAEARALDELGEKPLPITRGPPERRCADIVADWSRRHGVAPAPRCGAAWKLYYEDASAAFAAYDAEPGHEAAPSRSPRALPFSPASPFEEGR